MKRNGNARFCLTAVLSVLALTISVGPIKSSPSQAQALDEWRYVISTDDGSELYYSPRRTVRLPNGIIRAWTKLVQSKSDTQNSEMIGLDEYDCTGGRRRNIQNTMYRRKGEIRFSNRVDKWEYPTPESVGEEMLKKVCQDKSVFIGMTNGAEYYYFPNTLRRTAQSTRVLVKFVFPPDYEYNFMMCTDEFNCSTRRFRLLQCSHYDDDAKMVDSNNEPSDWLTPPGDSVVSKLRQTVCSRTQ